MHAARSAHSQRSGARVDYPTPPAEPDASVPASAALVKGLRVLGMPPREARLYLALVQQGPRVAREAAESAGLHRATAYRVLLRLLDRGLVIGDGRSPQRFQAIPPEVLLQRLTASLRDEEEVAQTLGEVYARSTSEVSSEAEGPTAGSMHPRLLAPGPGGSHLALTALSSARIGVDIVVRPLSLGAGYRTALVHTIARLARQGVRIRIITDATPADHRFVKALDKEAGEGPAVLQVRHSTPTVTHTYIIDGRRSVRFPALGLLGRNPEVAIELDDFARVRSHITRFESLWNEAAASVGRPHSTRSYGWKNAPERPPVTAPYSPPDYLRSGAPPRYLSSGEWSRADPRTTREPGRARS